MKMNAVKALVLALAVGVAQCQLQQDLLEQQDEDLFFPESLLVDPDEQTDTIDDSNSLEAPKEDESNGLEGPKEEIVYDIVKPKPTNRIISISDLANAVVLPSRSPKTHLDHSYFHGRESMSVEDSSEDSISDEDRSEIRDNEYDDNDSEEGSTKYEGSGRPHFNWDDMEGSGDEYGSGEVDGSGDYYDMGQEDYGDNTNFLDEADLEEFIPIKTGNLSSDIDSQTDVEYDGDEDNSIYPPVKNNLVINGYGGSLIGEMAKMDFLENEMHMVKGQISQLSARMEQQSNDISHLQMIIIQLQEQINGMIYRQNLLRD